LLEQPASDPNGGEILANLLFRQPTARAPLEHADVEGPGTPGELGAEIDALRTATGVAPDVAGKERGHRAPGHAAEVEVTRSFEEEVALLLEEQRASRQVDAAISTSVSAKSVLTLRFS
jgi:hypothetical protein